MTPAGRGPARARPPRAKTRGPWVAVVGARPNFVKLAPLVRAAREIGRDLPWIHTGQHADAAMSEAMIRDVGLPAPRVALDASSAGPDRIRRMAEALRAPLAALHPSVVVVLGDVDSTVAGAEAARALGIPVAHVEAGLRSFEKDLPEEANRIRVDGLSDLLHVSEPSGALNLRAEGVAAQRIHRAGNVMADALAFARAQILEGVARGGGPVVATLHRQANVDRPARLARFVHALLAVAREHPVVFPVHPRTARALAGAGRAASLARRGVFLVEPMPYLEFLRLVAGARAVVTDSGGLQVEASLLDVPCVTARRRTEHLLTVSHGTNHLAGADPRRLPAALRAALEAPRHRARRPRDWDGKAAERIVAQWGGLSSPSSI